MTLPHSPSRTGEAVDTGPGPGPNQWIKDHLDGLIDAHFLTDCPTSGTSPTSELDKGLPS